MALLDKTSHLWRITERVNIFKRISETADCFTETYIIHNYVWNDDLFNTISVRKSFNICGVIQPLSMALCFLTAKIFNFNINFLVFPVKRWFIEGFIEDTVMQIRNQV